MTARGKAAELPQGRNGHWPCLLSAYGADVGLRLCVLPDPHIIDLHRGGCLERMPSRIVKDYEHRRRSNPGGYSPDINAVIIVGYDSRLPVRGKGMPAVRICPAGAASSVAGAYPLGIGRAMKVRTHPAAEAFGDVDFTILGPVLTIEPHTRPVGSLARISGHRGQPYPRLDKTIRKAELALRADQASGVLRITYTAILALLNKRQVKRPIAFCHLSGIVTVLFLTVDRRGNARTEPAGRPVGRIQAGAVELTVKLERPVAGHAGRHRRRPGRTGRGRPG